MHRIEITNLKRHGAIATPSVVARQVARNGSAQAWVGLAPGYSITLELPDGGEIEVVGVEHGAPKSPEPPAALSQPIAINLSQAHQLVQALIASQANGFGNAGLLVPIEGSLLLEFDDDPQSSFLLEPSQPYEPPTASSELLRSHASELLEACKAAAVVLRDCNATNAFYRVRRAIESVGGAVEAS